MTDHGLRSAVDHLRAGAVNTNAAAGLLDSRGPALGPRCHYDWGAQFLLDDHMLHRASTVLQAGGFLHVQGRILFPRHLPQQLVHLH